jgi:hypothetical protein
MASKLATLHGCYVLSLAALVIGCAATSPAHGDSRWRQNIWAGDNLYQQCIRSISSGFQECLRTPRQVPVPPGEHYKMCASQWTRQKGDCWAGYKLYLANRGGVWNPTPGVSRGPLPPISRGPLYPRNSVAPRAMPSYVAARPTPRFAPAPRSMATAYRSPRAATPTVARRHQPGGVIRDPVPVVRRSPSRGP